MSCSNCGNPICPDCMTPTPVGMRCPECSKQKTQVRNVRAQYDARPRVTIGLIAHQRPDLLRDELAVGPRRAGGHFFTDYGLYGPLVRRRASTGGWSRAASCTAGLLHIGFNMYILWFLGNLLEPSLGPWRFGGLYFASLLLGLVRA